RAAGPRGAARPRGAPPRMDARAGAAARVDDAEAVGGDVRCVQDREPRRLGAAGPHGSESELTMTARMPSGYLRRFAAAAIALAAAGTPIRAHDSAGHDHAAAAARVVTLPHELEVRLAVDALPKELRDGATVLVMEPAGYVKARPGTNAFTCMVSRRGGNLYPVCFDE